VSADISGAFDVDGATTLDQVSIDTADGPFAVSGANATNISTQANLSGGTAISGSDMTIANGIDFVGLTDAGSALGSGGASGVDFSEIHVERTDRQVVNGHGSTLNIGEIVQPDTAGTNQVEGVDALTSATYNGILGVVTDSTIANAATGAIAVTGEVLVQFVTGLTLTVGDCWFPEATATAADKVKATNVVNTGDDEVVQRGGYVLDTTLYAGSQQAICSLDPGPIIVLTA
jgi:hypothetical protein